MSVTKADIERVAALAALEVDEKSLPALTAQIAGILDYVAQLNNAPAAAAGDGPLSMSDHPGPLRDDVVRPDPLDRKPKEIAPEFREGLFIVPAIGRIEEA